MADTPDFIPDSQFQADAPTQTAQAAPANSAPGFIPDDQFQPDDEKYGTLGQEVATGLEGAAQGLAGPLAPLAERALGVSPQDIRLRAQTNPWIHGLTEAGGFGAGLLAGTGEAALVGKAGSAVSNALKLGGEGASVGSRLAAGAARAATEMGLIQAGDEATKVITQDPNQTVGSAAANVGLSALLGGIAGTAFTGIGIAAKNALSSGVLKEFADRLAWRNSNVNPNEMMEKEFNDAISTYHSMNDEVLGPQGLKAQALKSVLPQEMTPEINNQIQEVANRSQDTLRKMIDAQVPERYINKFMSAVNDLQEVATDPQASPSDNFDALNDFKKTLQGYSKGNYGPFSIPSYHEAYDFLNLTKGLGSDVRQALEDPEVWGKAADLQKNLNKSWVDVLPAVKDAQSKFMEKVGGEYVPSTTKFNTYTNQAGKATSQTIRQKMMGNFVDAMEKHFNTVDDLYKAAGVENPFPPVGMGTLKESLERPSLGARLADAWHDKLGPNALGEGAGAGVGGAIGHAVFPGGGGFAGAYAGKELLGPTFGSIIKGVMEKSANSRAAQQAIAFGKAAINGDKSLTNSAIDLFKAGAKTVPENLLPDSSDIDKLDEQIKNVTQNPAPMTNVAGDLGHYMPNHAAAYAMTTMNAVNMLNSQRPSNPKANPLDADIPVSKAQEAAFRRKLAIAQQPLTIMKHIKEGTLLPSDVATVRQIYPAYYQQMSQKLMSAMTDHISQGGKIPYQTRQGLSLFLGQPLDSTMTPQSISSIQATYAAKTPSAQPQGAPKTKKGSAKLGKLSESLQTTDQARAARMNQS